MRCRDLFILLIFFYAPIQNVGAQENYPEGFAEETVFDEFDQPAGILFADTNLAVVWELTGKVWVIKNEIVSSAPVIDITEEVARWGDHGMIGATLHPDFLENGLIYLWYSVDRHYLMNYGTPAYDPNQTEEYTSSMGRLTRYALNTSDFESIVPDSRNVMIGSTPSNGLPICAPSHGVGALLFGKDGSLLVSTGDGNTWVGSSSTTGFNGEGPLPAFAFDDIALEDGIITNEENLGAFRSQYLDGLNGKILRLDPETGFGIPGNPYYDQNNPDTPRSKIWSLGFRNPYRMVLKPGTGGGNLENGYPGTLYVGDVGDWEWEEVNVVREGGLNFGWPMYQGPIVHDYYNVVRTRSTNAPNPLADSESCSPYFDFQDLILPPNQFHNYVYSNPCNTLAEIPDDIETFVHERPVLAFANSNNDEFNYAVVPIYDELGDADYAILGDADSGASGEGFTGISGTAGDFLEGPQIPEEYQGWYLFGDFTGWLRAAKFSETDELEEVELWNSFIGAPIHISQNSFDGCIYVTSISPPEIKRICFGGNLKPIINVTPELVFGSSPQIVNFDASESFDPEGEPLSYSWNFGDGSTGSGESISHTFIAPSNEVTNFTVVLTISDGTGGENSTEILISLNNTPPETQIISIEEGDLYSTQFPSALNLVAQTVDAEHTEDQLNYSWELLLHHNTHFHDLAAETGNNEIFQIYPTGCSEFETYWYEIVLTVTDPGGLMSVDRRNIYSDCEGILVPENMGDRDFILVPNPATDFIELRSRKAMGNKLEYRIFSPDGRIVMEETVAIFNGRQFTRISISALNSGGYVIQFKVKDQWHTERFIKLANQ